MRAAEFAGSNPEFAGLVLRCGVPIWLHGESAVMTKSIRRGLPADV
jgi:hypothetical protein